MTALWLILVFNAVLAAVPPYGLWNAINALCAAVLLVTIMVVNHDQW